MRSIVFFHACLGVYDSYENEILSLMTFSAELERRGYTTEIVDLSYREYEPGCAAFFAEKYDISIFAGNDLDTIHTCVNEIHCNNIDTDIVAVGHAAYLNRDMMYEKTAIEKYLFGMSWKIIEQYCEGKTDDLVDLKTPVLGEPRLPDLKNMSIPNRERVAHHGLYYDNAMPGHIDIFGRNTAIIFMTQGVKDHELSPLYQNTVFFRTVESVYSEVELLKIKYGITSLSFIDHDFLADASIAEKLVKRLYNDMNISFKFKTFQNIDANFKNFLLSHGYVEYL